MLIFPFKNSYCNSIYFNNPGEHGLWEVTELLSFFLLKDINRSIIVREAGYFPLWPFYFLLCCINYFSIAVVKYQVQCKVERIQLGLQIHRVREHDDGEKAWWQEDLRFHISKTSRRQRALWETSKPVLSNTSPNPAQRVQPTGH